MNHTKNGGGGRDRTDDLKLAKLPLSQLSYAPDRKMVGLGRLELPTSRLSGVRSNRAELQARMIGPCPTQILLLLKNQKQHIWIGQIGKGYEDGGRY